MSATGATASASAANPTSSASIGSASAASVSSAAGASGNSVALSLRSALAVLCGGKVARVAAAFATFRFLRGADGSPLFFYLFCVVAGASAVLLSLQRPWSGRRIGAKRWRKVRLTARARRPAWLTRPLCVSCSISAGVCAFRLACPYELSPFSQVYTAACFCTRAWSSHIVFRHSFESCFLLPSWLRFPLAIASTSLLLLPFALWCPYFRHPSGGTDCGLWRNVGSDAVRVGGRSQVMWPAARSACRRCGVAPSVRFVYRPSA